MIATHNYNIDERLLVCGGEIAFARGEGNSASVRKSVMEDLMSALATEESGAVIVEAVQRARTKERRLFEQFLAKQK